MFSFCIFALLLAATGTIFPLSAGAADSTSQTADKEQLKQALRELLKEDPDLVLSVLRENSELVLEIAQHGSIVRNRKGMIARWQEDLKNKVDINTEGRAVRGSKNAPVTIVGFTDFTCSYCIKAEGDILALLEKYKGKVRFIYMPFPKEDELSQLAARYSAAAFMQDQEKGWAYYDILFDAGPKLVSGGEAFLRASALQVGLDGKKLFSEVNSKAVTDSLQKNKAEAEKLDVRGTPYFFVNNLVIRGYVAPDLFEEAVEMALKNAK